MKRLALHFRRALVRVTLRLRELSSLNALPRTQFPTSGGLKQVMFALQALTNL